MIVSLLFELTKTPLEKELKKLQNELKQPFIYYVLRSFGINILFAVVFLSIIW